MYICDLKNITKLFKTYSELCPAHPLPSAEAIKSSSVFSEVYGMKEF
jgi:hypothetical protein